MNSLWRLKIIAATKITFNLFSLIMENITMTFSLFSPFYYCYFISRIFQHYNFEKLISIIFIF